MYIKFFIIFFVSNLFIYAGAGFESDNYLIWISSKCPEQSKTCTNVTYMQTQKNNGKTIVINGGEPIVGTLSGNLIGYTFKDIKTEISYELSMDLDSVYYLYIRFPRRMEKEKVKRITDQEYQIKISQLNKK